MNLTSSTVNGWFAIHVDGQIDSKTVTALRDFIDEQITEQRPVVLDLTNVPFMSSAGLRTLLTLHRRTQQLATDLALVGLVDGIVETMRVTGFYDYFVVYHSLSLLPEHS
jgi:anti-sigma B factor antagonist